jgi:hypothetical protein
MNGSRVSCRRPTADAASVEQRAMRMVETRVRPLRAVLGGCLVLLAGAPVVSAQAWLPPRGEAALTLGYARLWNTEQVNYLGESVFPGNTVWNTIALDLSYGVTDRFAVRLGVPFMISKYDGAYPHPPLGGVTPDDDGRWHSSFQDFTSDLRYRVTDGSWVVTPMVGFAVPTHHYLSYGRSAVGSDLVVGRFGVAVGRLLDPLLPDAYLQIHYMYAIPERVLGISHTSSNLDVELGYLLGSALNVRVMGFWKSTYGGWRLPVDFPPMTSADFLHHDQLESTDYFRLGGAVGYSITNAIDLNLYGYATVTARSDTNMKSFGVAITYSASPAQLLRKKRAAQKGQ